METATTKRINSVPPLYQMVFVLITSVAMVAIVSQRLARFRTFDSYPNVEVITPEIVAELHGFPTKIKVGLHISQFEKFDVVRNNFEFTGIVWFLFSPGIIPLDILKQFEFERGTFIHKSEPIIEIHKEKTLVQYDVRVNFTSPLSFIDFPINDHTVHLKIINRFVSPGEIIFNSHEREFTTVANTIIFGWDLVGKKVETGFSKTVLDPYDASKTRNYPAAVFSLDYSQFGMRYLISIILPLLLIFFLSIICLSLQRDTNITVSTGALTATLAYKWIIDNLSPRVGYFMLSDYLFFIFLASTFTVFSTIILDSFAVPIPVRIKKAIVALLHFTLISMTWFLVFN